MGVLYCKANQSSEEEMYNNAEAGPAFEEFLALLGEKVCLRGFSQYAAQLDIKSRSPSAREGSWPQGHCSSCSELCPVCHFAADSTGTHSLYTTYQGYEIMFHVSTMLPYTPNNRQQVTGCWHGTRLYLRPCPGLRESTALRLFRCPLHAPRLSSDHSQ